MKYEIKYLLVNYIELVRYAYFESAHRSITLILVRSMNMVKYFVMSLCISNYKVKPLEQS